MFIIKKKGIIIIILLIGVGITIGSLTFLFLNSGGIRYSHTIKIDGANDFYTYETFTTSSVNYTGYIAWDQDYLYLGMSGEDLESGREDGLKWILIYIGNGSSGTTIGHPYTDQQPNLPFMATHHIRWNTDNTDKTAFEWNGSLWIDAPWDITADDIFHNAAIAFFEMRILLADIGSPSIISVHVNMINENPAPDFWTYAGVPSTSFTDGQDPEYFSKYFQFDLYGSKRPTDYTPI